MGDDNSVIQCEELEAVAAIYADDWRVVDVDRQVFSIDITASQTAQPDVTTSQTAQNDAGTRTVNFQMTLPPQYPKNAPPTYQVGAPWLSREHRCKLMAHLEDVYSDHIGECIIFAWVEAIREYLETYAAHFETEGSTEESCEVAPPDDDDLAACLAAQRIADDCNYESWKRFSPSDSLPSGGKCPEIHDTEIVSDRKSKFQGHLARVTAVVEVKLVLKKLYENRKIASATHNIYAYRIEKTGNGAKEVTTQFIEDCEDDGEHTASRKMLHMLSIMDARNVLVVVTRWYGGIHLGQDRFKHINGITRQLLEEHGYVKLKQSKKGTKSGKGNK